MITIHIKSKSIQCILKKLLFFVDFGQALAVLPYFLENDFVQAINIHSEHYRWMVTNFFFDVNWIILTPTTCGFNRSDVSQIKYSSRGMI